MSEGRIVRVVRDRGFCFVSDSETKKEYFAHHSAFKNTKWEDVHEGQDCKFEAGVGPKGPRAEDVYVE